MGFYQNKAKYYTIVNEKVAEFKKNYMRKKMIYIFQKAFGFKIFAAYLTIQFLRNHSVFRILRLVL